MLCPGVAVADEADDDGNNANTVVENMQVWKEFPKETTADIIEMLVPTTIASNLANSISDTYNLTSEVYLDATADLGEEVTGRSKIWKGMIQDYQESGKCNYMYSN